MSATIKVLPAVGPLPAERPPAARLGSRSRRRPRNRDQLELVMALPAPPAPAQSFERFLLAAIADDLNQLTAADVAVLADDNVRTAENWQSRRNLPRLPAFLALLGGRANLAVAVFRELLRRDLLQPEVAAAIAGELAGPRPRKAAAG